MPLSPQVKQAVRQYGPTVNRLARSRYGISGKDLLAKLIQGESGGDPTATSNVGAHGLTQFMPSTRQSFIKAYGIDPWRSPDEAVHAAALHLSGALGHGKGLEGYNPGGGQGYVNYILGQGAHVSGRGHPRQGGGQQTQPSSSPPALPDFNLQPGADTSGLLASLLGEQRQAPPVGQLAPSAHAAHAALPQGYQGLQSSGGPVPRRDVSSLLEAISGAGASIPAVSGPGLLGDAQNGGNGSSKRRGRPLTEGHSATSVINNIQGWVRSELGLAAGSRDRTRSQNAAAGGSATSDHLEEPGMFGGREAEDFPTTAAQGGWEQYRKIARRLGLKPASNGFTQGTIKQGGKRFRVQIIFGEQNDHGDHIHVGVRRA